MSALPQNPQDPDTQETREWLDALSAVIQAEGGERAHQLLDELLDHARQSGLDMPFSANTAYVNTIATDDEVRSPGNVEIEERLRAALIDGLGLKPRVAFGPVRIAVTGSRVSPPLFESMELLGRDRSLARLRDALGDA